MAGAMGKTLVCFTSWGNDSVALLQWAVLNGLAERWKVYALYTNTGWAAPYWAARVEQGAAWCLERGIEPVELQTMGFEALVRRETNGKGKPPGRFPTGREKFCTRHLKILPAQRWLDEVDPEELFICANGKRRAESEARAYSPAIVPVSEHHGGRLLLQPLVEYTDEMRDELVRDAGFEVLPHRSDECEPCIFSARADLRRVTPEKVDRIRAMEQDTGKTMFRPKAYAGAEGIDEVMRWARSERGQYKPPSGAVVPTSEEGEDVAKDCESDFCGL